MDQPSWHGPQQRAPYVSSRYAERANAPQLEGETGQAGSARFGGRLLPTNRGTGGMFSLSRLKRRFGAGRRTTLRLLAAEAAEAAAAAERGMRGERFAGCLSAAPVQQATGLSTWETWCKEQGYLLHPTTAVMQVAAQASPARKLAHHG